MVSGSVSLWGFVFYVFCVFVSYAFSLDFFPLWFVCFVCLFLERDRDNEGIEFDE